MSIDIPRVSGTAFSADASIDGQILQVRYSGTADLESKEDLEAVVAKVHEEACRLGVEKVVVDFRELEFMNSSCFKTFVAWLAKVQELGGDSQYRIHFVSNPSLHWQRRSLAALSCFAVDLVAIET